MQTASLFVQAYYLDYYLAINPLTLIPLIAVYLVYSILFLLTLTLTQFDSIELRTFMFYYYVIGQCVVAKVIQLTWFKLDAEILCTINESRKRYTIVTIPCRKNPDLLFNFYLFEAAMITLRFIVDVYFARKLKQYVKEAIISEARDRRSNLE